MPHMRQTLGSRTTEQLAEGLLTVRGIAVEPGMRQLRISWRTDSDDQVTTLAMRRVPGLSHDCPLDAARAGAAQQSVHASLRGSREGGRSGSRQRAV